MDRKGEQGGETERMETTVSSSSRVMEKALDPTAVPGLRRVERRDPSTCSGRKDGAQELRGSGWVRDIRGTGEVLSS